MVSRDATTASDADPTEGHRLHPHALKMTTVVSVTSGADLLRVASLEPGEAVLVGRDPSAQLVLHDPSVSRRHCFFSHDSEGIRIADLGSTHGTRVNGDRLTEPRRVAFGDRIELGGVILRIDRIDEVELERLQAVAPRVDAARFDPPTGLLNRRWLGPELDAAVAAARARGAPMSMAMFEIDGFTALERSGQATCDGAVRTIARLVMYGVRPSDQAVRYHPHQIAVFMANCSERLGFENAEHVRQRVKAHPWAQLGLAPLTVSAAVAQLGRDEVVDAWLERAEAGLLLSVQGGRDRTSLAPSPSGGGTRTIPDER